MTTEKTDNDYRVLKTTTCPSLSGRSEITAEYSFHEPSKTIMFRLIENTGSGHFSTAHIKLDDILKCLQEAKEPFSLSVFKELYPKMSSTNNPGFLGTVLKRESLIVCEKRQYIKKDTKAFLADINKLVKTTPAKKSPARKTTKTAAKEAPK